MKKNLLIILFSILPLFTCLSQRYSGKIVDENQQPVPYAAVTAYLKADQTVLKGTVSNDVGDFTLTITTENPFYITVSYVGFETVKIDPQKELLASIVLKESSTALSEVVVAAKKPLLIRKSDRMVFAIDQTVVQELGSAMDVLQVTPNIVMRDETLTMLGKDEVQVMINGRMLPLQGEDLQNYLLSINSADIEKIEVMTVPPAEFDAVGNGGVLNIILKKQKQDFWNVTARLSSVQRTAFSYARNLALNYKKKNTYVTASVDQATYIKNNTFNQTYFYEDETWLGHSVSNFERDHFNYRIGISQNLSESWELGGSYVGTSSESASKMPNNDKVFDLSETLKYNLNSINIDENDAKTHAVNIYTVIHIDSLGKQLTADIDFYDSTAEKFGDNFGTRTENDATTPSFANQTTLDYNFKNWSGKIDLVFPTKFINLKFGGKISLSETNNDFRFYDNETGTPILNNNQSNLFIYNENIFAGYIAAHKKLAPKITLDAGLRLEQTETEGYSQSINRTESNRYLNIFPTMFLNYKLAEGKTMALNFNKRVNRPIFEMLDPFVIVISPFMTAQGNPFLRPSYITALEWVFNTRKNELKLYAQKTEDGYAQIGKINPDTKIVNYTYDNFLESHSIGFTNTYIYDALDWLSSYNTVDINYVKGTSSIPETLAQLEGINSFIETKNNIRLNTDNTFTMGVNYYYVFPAKRGVQEAKGFGALDYSLQLKFFDKSLSLSLLATDILKTAKYQRTSYYNDVKSNSDNYFDVQSIQIIGRYTIGNQQLKTKRLRSGNQEIQNRG